MKLIIQPDGRIVIIGNVDAASSVHCAITRLAPDGTIDLSFGAAGWALLPEIQCWSKRLLL